MKQKITKEEYAQALENGVSGAMLRDRINRNWDREEAITRPKLTQAEITARAKAASPFEKSNELFFRKEIPARWVDGRWANE